MAWVYYYAHPSSDILLHLNALKLLESERVPFFEKHAARKKRLLNHVERLIQKKPLVTSEKLIKSGIKPGTTMGILLAQAERIAIRNNLEDPAGVIELLKQTNTLDPWQKELRA